MTLVPIAYAATEPEADLLVQRLAAAGILASPRVASPPQLGASGGSDILVDERFEQQARELLETPEFTDEELARLSDEAGRTYGNPPED
ncbi:MAG: hypothetical protein ACRDLP_15755 [Solirubrobacteraceae bacterium]